MLRSTWKIVVLVPVLAAARPPIAPHCFSQLLAQESAPVLDRSARFMINITEFGVRPELAQKFEGQDWAAALQQGKTDGDVSVVETVEFTACAGSPATVQFGRTVNVPTGPFSVPNRGQAYQGYQRQQVGTMANAVLHQKDEQLLIELNFEASRPETDGKENATPEIQQFTIKSTFPVTLSRPQLLCRVHGQHRSSLVVLTVKPIP